MRLSSYVGCWFQVLVLFFLLVPLEGLVLANPGGEAVSDVSFDLGEGPWLVEGDRAEFDPDEGVISVTGNVRISQEGRFLTADQVIYHQTLQEAEAIGNVLVVSHQGSARGERLWIDMKNRLGKIQAGEIFIRDGNYYLRGESIEKVGENRYHLVDSSFTSCDGDCPAWSFKGKEIRVTIDGYAFLTSAVFEVKGIPVLYVPYFVVPAKVTRQTGLLIPRPEYSTRSGFGIDVPFYWAISDQADATLYEHYMWDRGLKQGAELRYLTSDQSGGTIQFDFLNDQLDDDGYINDGYSRTNESRWWLRSKHDQELPWDASLKLDLDLASDQDFLREFSSSYSGFRSSNQAFMKDYGRSLGEETSLYRKSVLNATKNWDQAGVTGSATYFQSLVKEPENRTAQQLPSLAFSVPSLPLGNSPVFAQLDADHSYFWRADGPRGHRTRLNPEISLPHRLDSGLVISPFARVDETVYYVENEADGVESGTDSRFEGGGGVETNAVLSRVFDVGAGSLTRMRHEIKPVVRYEYRAVNRSTEGPMFDPYDGIEDANRISYGVLNVLKGRFDGAGGERSYRDLARMRVLQSYDFDENPVDRVDPGEAVDEPHRLSDLSFEMEVYPFSYLQMFTDAMIDTYDGQVAEFNSYLMGRDPRGDFFSLDYRYTRDRVEQLNAFVRFKVTENFFLLGNVKRTLKGDATIETGAGAQLQFQCWGMLMKYEELEDDDRFMVLFDLAGVGYAGPLSTGF